MIAARVIRKRKSCGGFFSCRRSHKMSTRGSKTQLPWIRNRCDRHHHHCSSFSFLWKSRCFYTCYCILGYCFSCNNLCYDFVQFMNYPPCGDWAFSASFVRKCTDVSYVAGEGVELIVHKESVVIEGGGTDISSCAIYLWQKLWSKWHAVMHLADFRWRIRRLLHKSRKLRVFLWKSIQK